MEEFETLEKVKKLFDDKEYKGTNPIYIALCKDFKKYSGMVAGMEYPYDGLLLAISDEGIGYYYLKNPKLSLMIKMEKLVVNKDSYTFIPSSDIKSIEVKKFALLDKKRKEVIIKTTDKKTHYLHGLVEDTLLPYNTDSMSKLIEKYSGK